MAPTGEWLDRPCRCNRGPVQVQAPAESVLQYPAKDCQALVLPPERSLLPELVARKNVVVAIAAHPSAFAESGPSHQSFRVPMTSRIQNKLEILTDATGVKAVMPFLEEKTVNALWIAVEFQC